MSSAVIQQTLEDSNNIVENAFYQTISSYEAMLGVDATIKLIKSLKESFKEDVS